MPSITIRDIPDELFERVKELAKEDRRSINAEVIDVLDKAVQHRNLRHNAYAHLRNSPGLERASLRPTKRKPWKCYVKDDGDNEQTDSLRD